MTVEEREQIRQKIIVDIDTVKDEILQLEAKCQPIEPDCSLGRLTRMEAMQEKEVSDHLLQEAKIRLNKLEYAFRKIDEPSYGVCVECDEPIPVGRLMVMPEASRCVDCAG